MVAARPLIEPIPRLYTWDDFVLLDDEDKRELIDGQLVEVEVPTSEHEEFVMALGYFLVGWARQHGGRVLGSGYKVKIRRDRGVMPDVQYFRAGRNPPSQGLSEGAPDLAVEIETGTGSLAPRYHFDYQLRVERNGAATLTYWPGYGQDDAHAVRARFTLADADVRVLASLARQLQRSPGPIDDRDIPDGGRSARITLIAAGRRSVMEEWQREPFDGWQRALQERSRRVIPDSVWARCEDAQRRHAERDTP